MLSCGKFPQRCYAAPITAYVHLPSEQYPAGSLPRMSVRLMRIVPGLSGSYPEFRRVRLCNTGLFFLYFVKYGAYFAARRIASFILTLLTKFFPAISNAVPWSTEVLRMGIPFVIEIVFSKSSVFVAICPWS